VRFFFDNCISSNLTAAMGLLTASHHEIEHLTKRFSADALDEEWLPKLAHEHDLVIVSADPTITTAKKEREIWRQSGLTSFFFGGDFSRLPIWTQVCEVVNWWPEIVREAKDAPRGTGYLLPLKGSKKRPKRIYEPRGGGLSL
jgi:hypothetical protein